MSFARWMDVVVLLQSSIGKMQKLAREHDIPDADHSFSKAVMFAREALDTAHTMARAATPAPVQAEGPRDDWQGAFVDKWAEEMFQWMGMGCERWRNVGRKRFMEALLADLPVSAAAGRLVLSEADLEAIDWARIAVLDDRDRPRDQYEESAVKIWRDENRWDRALAVLDRLMGSPDRSGEVNAAPPTAETVPLTVAMALMLPEVRSGAKWIESSRALDGGGTETMSLRVRGGSEIVNRYSGRPVTLDLETLYRQCNLVEPAGASEGATYCAQCFFNGYGKLWTVNGECPNPACVLKPRTAPPAKTEEGAGE